MAGRRRFGGRVAQALLTLAALAGLACIVLVALGLFFHVSLIMFKTGSMSPTIPQGSVALVREIPAAEVRVGDVVTVDRPGELPITHRVMSVRGSGDARTITMKGDANPAPDPAPYTVSQVRLVMGSVPGLARVIVWFADPLVLGALTIGAAALVTWAFWPRDARDRDDDTGDTGGGDDAGDINDTDDTADGGGTSGDGTSGDGGPAGTATHDAAAVTGQSGGRHARQPGRTLSLLLVLGLAGALPIAAAGPARAAAPEVSGGRYLTVTNIADTAAMSALSPGVPVRWQVGVALARAAGTRAVVDLSTRGSLDLQVHLRGCTERWVAGSCPGAVVPVASVAGFTGRQHDLVLVDVPAGAQRWLLFRVSLPAPARGTMSATVRASASGESVSAGTGSGSLPNTGVDPWRPLLLAVGAIAVGLTIAGAASRTRRRA